MNIQTSCNQFLKLNCKTICMVCPQCEEIFVLVHTLRIINLNQLRSVSIQISVWYVQVIQPLMTNPKHHSELIYHLGVLSLYEPEICEFQRNYYSSRNQAKLINFRKTLCIEFGGIPAHCWTIIYSVVILERSYDHCPHTI